jgi:hypothetical protein
VFFSLSFCLFVSLSLFISLCLSFLTFLSQSLIFYGTHSNNIDSILAEGFKVDAVPNDCPKGELLLSTSWATQLCLGFVSSVSLSLCLSPLSLFLHISPIYLSIYLFLPSISLSFIFSHLSLYLSFSPIYLSISPLYLSISPIYLSISVSLSPSPSLFPDKKFPALGPIPSFRSKFGDSTFI